jgi:hypothetical protein
LFAGVHLRADHVYAIFLLLLTALTLLRVELVQRFDGYLRKFTGAMRLRSITSIGDTRAARKIGAGSL